MDDYENDGDWECDNAPQGNRYENAYGSYVGGYGPVGPIGMRRGPRGPPPMGPPFGGMGPEYIMGRGYGPGGPPFRRSTFEDRAVKYLMRCGLSGDGLKNLPRPFLMLIEPQYCGVCGMEFDSFALSRIHYTSKNHFKNQKKWLSQYHNNAGNFQNIRELPLKARELYCELCDVHITSKSHSDSHYAGKPHRAIVEGRKVVKNPVLLSLEMKNRLEQLIRREKRHLKSEEAAAVDAEPVSAKEVKPLAPELYCNICKTSVTCTEQMTIHLNGKRHLTKEKSYIMRIMKGENVNAEPEGGEDNAEVIDCDADDDGVAANTAGVSDGANGAGDGGNGTVVGGNGTEKNAADDWQDGTGEAWNEF